MSSEPRFWARRLRWRLRGAWQWPAFGVLTVADGVILHLLPPSRTGVDLVPGLIIASFANLILVGAVAPWLARRLTRRDPGGLPREVVHDRTATGLLLVGALAVTAAGLAARPAVIAETEDTEINARAVRDYVLANGSEEIKRNLGTANTIRLEEGYFRTCVAADDRRRAYCMFVDTNADPPTVRRDPNSLPNAEFYPRGVR